MHPHFNSPPVWVHPTHKVESLPTSFSPDSLLLSVVHNTVRKHCKLATKGNARPAKGTGFLGASESDRGDLCELRAKLFYILSWKMCGQAASRVGLPVATRVIREHRRWPRGTEEGGRVHGLRHIFRTGQDSLWVLENIDNAVNIRDNDKRAKDFI